MDNLVWTKHALERNKERQITISWVEQTVNNPGSFSEIEEGKTKFEKKFGIQTVWVVCTKTDSGKYLVLSSWINPPIIGTKDYKNKQYSKELSKSGLLRKFWLTLLHQIGL